MPHGGGARGLEEDGIGGGGSATGNQSETRCSEVV